MVTLSIEHQAIINELWTFYEANGFIREEEALNLMSTHNVSLKDTERLTGILIDLGVIFTENRTSDKSQNIDRTRTDYESIFKKILSIAPEQIFLINHIRKTRPPQRREWVTLMPKAKAGNTYALNRLFDMYLRNVVKLSLSVYKNSNYELDDLVQEGSIGLMRAIQKYDLTKHGSFASYSSYLIMRFMERAIAISHNFIRIPVHMIETMRKYKIVANRLKGRSKRIPTTKDIAAEMEIEYARAKQIEGCFYSIESLEEHMVERNDGFIEYELVEERFCMIDEIDRCLLRKQIINVLDTLPSREADVIRFRVGFDDGREQTLDEIGITFNVTRERIRQIESKALRNLRLPSARKKLIDFWL